MVEKNFFISFNSADREWAEWVAWTLEEVKYSTIIQTWDFRPGENFILEMQRAAITCERTIMVLSANYLASLFTQPEWTAAFVNDPQGRARKLVPVRVASCELPGLLQSIVYCDLVGLNEAVAKKSLLEAVSKERPKPSSKPSFPGRAPSFPGITSMVPPRDMSEEVAAIRELLDILGTSYQTFVAQCRIRNEVVEEMRKRLKIEERLEYERFFSRYYSTMTDEERYLHNIIRSYTANVLSEYNARALEIMQQHPDLLDKINLLPELKRHLIIWLSKYKGVFQETKSMCLVYVGVEEKVPFPRGVEQELKTYLNLITKPAPKQEAVVTTRKSRKRPSKTRTRN